MAHFRKIQIIFNLKLLITCFSWKSQSHFTPHDLYSVFRVHFWCYRNIYLACHWLLVTAENRKKKLGLGQVKWTRYDPGHSVQWAVIKNRADLSVHSTFISNFIRQIMNSHSVVGYFLSSFHHWSIHSYSSINVNFNHPTANDVTDADVM